MKIFDEENQIKYNRLSLLILMLIFICGSVIYWLYSAKHESQFQKIYLFFTDSSFSKLYKEDRKIRMSPQLNERLELTLNLLLNGPLNYKYRPLLSNRAKIKSFWYLNNILHINFSKELVQFVNPKIHDDRLIIYSILASFFKSFSEVKKIRLYIEDSPIKTISGLYNFNHLYESNLFLNSYKEILSGS